MTNQGIMSIVELDRMRNSLISDFLLGLTTSPQCPTPQPIPVSGLLLLARGYHVDSIYIPAPQTPYSKHTFIYCIECTVNFYNLRSFMHIYILDYIFLNNAFSLYWKKNKNPDTCNKYTTVCHYRIPPMRCVVKPSPWDSAGCHLSQVVTI